jgi:hypothetical protein
MTSYADFTRFWAYFVVEDNVPGTAEKRVRRGPGKFTGQAARWEIGRTF